MQIPFDSRKDYYRSPFGAVEQGTSIHLRVLIPHHFKTSNVELCVKYDNDYNWNFYNSSGMVILTMKARFGSAISLLMKWAFTGTALSLTQMRA